MIQTPYVYLYHCRGPPRKHKSTDLFLAWGHESALESAPVCGPYCLWASGTNCIQ